MSKVSDLHKKWSHDSDYLAAMKNSAWSLTWPVC